MLRPCVLLVVLLAAAAGPAAAATFTVTKTANTTDGVCGDADCSLSDAIVAGVPRECITIVVSNRRETSTIAGSSSPRTSLPSTSRCRE